MAPTRGPAPEDKSDEIRRVLRANERPFMGTGELADELGYKSNPGVNKHLKRAKENNKLEHTTISGYNIWYLPELSNFDPDEHTTPSENADSNSGSGGPPGGNGSLPEPTTSRPTKEMGTDKTGQLSSIGEPVAPGIFTWTERTMYLMALSITGFGVGSASVYGGILSDTMATQILVQAAFVLSLVAGLFTILLAGTWLGKYLFSGYTLKELPSYLSKVER